MQKNHNIKIFSGLTAAVTVLALGATGAVAAPDSSAQDDEDSLSAQLQAAQGSGSTSTKRGAEPDVPRYRGRNRSQSLLAAVLGRERTGGAQWQGGVHAVPLADWPT